MRNEGKHICHLINDNKYVSAVSVIVPSVEIFLGRNKKKKKKKKKKKIIFLFLNNEPNKKVSVVEI